MWMTAQIVTLSIALFVLNAKFCCADNGPVPSISSNSTHTSHTSSAKRSTTSAHTSLSSKSTGTFGTITSAPPWGDQVFPVNTCSVSETNGEFQYTPCNIFAGTVYMSYFPENSGNVTYPSTYYDPTLSITLSSPSIYMVVNTITGGNSCGPLGPTYSNAVISMELTDLSTLQPYADRTVTTRMGPPQQLTLNDLMSNCPTTYSTFSTDGAFLKTHPLYNTYNRCHPRFVFPIELKRLGYPYWMHCSNQDYELGIFDPPAPVPPVSGLLPQTTSYVPFTSTSTSASTLPGTPSQPSKTSPTHITSTSSSTTASHSSSPVEHEETTAGVLSVGSPSSTSHSSSVPKMITHAPVTSPTSTTIIAIVGTNSIGAVPGSPGVVLPNGSTVHPGSVATITGSHSRPVIISVASSGVFLGGKTGSSTFIPNPTIVPIPIVTWDGSTISAAPEASSIIIGTKTVLLNGPPVTVGDSVFKLTPTGLVVEDAGGKSSSVFALPTSGPSSPGVFKFTIDDIKVLVTAGASSIVIGTQTITYGGSLITLSNHDVLSLGSAGLIIQMPSGRVSTMTIARSVAAQTSSATKTTSTGKNIGSIIASIGGLGNATSIVKPAITTTPLISTPVLVPTGAGSRVTVGSAFVWTGVCFVFGLVSWM